MRHRKAGRKLNRSWEHRKAMYRNMARSLVVHESIRTTEARAKEMRKVADNLVTLAIRGDLHAKRQAYKVLGDHGLVKRLFDEIGPRFAGISGGYTRVVKLGLPRPGDAAPMAVIEFSLRPGETGEKEEKAKKKAKKAEPKKAAKKTPAKAAEAETKAEEAEAAAEEKSAEAEVKAEEAKAKAEEAPAEEAEAKAEEAEAKAEEAEVKAEEAQAKAEEAEAKAEEAEAKAEEAEAEAEDAEEAPAEEDSEEKEK